MLKSIVGGKSGVLSWLRAPDWSDSLFLQPCSRDQKNLGENTERALAQHQRRAAILFSGRHKRHTRSRAADSKRLGAPRWCRRYTQGGFSYFFLGSIRGSGIWNIQFITFFTLHLHGQVFRYSYGRKGTNYNEELCPLILQKCRLLNSATAIY